MPSLKPHCCSTCTDKVFASSFASSLDITGPPPWYFSDGCNSVFDNRFPSSKWRIVEVLCWLSWRVVRSDNPNPWQRIGVQNATTFPLRYYQREPQSLLICADQLVLATPAEILYRLRTLCSSRRI